MSCSQTIESDTRQNNLTLNNKDWHKNRGFSPPIGWKPRKHWTLVSSYIVGRTLPYSMGAILVSDYFVFRQWQQDYRTPITRAPQCQTRLSLNSHDRDDLPHFSQLRPGRPVGVPGVIDWPNTGSGLLPVFGGGPSGRIGFGAEQWYCKSWLKRTPST